MPALALGLGLGFSGRGRGGPVSYDADAQSYFDRVTAAGATLTNQRKSAINTLFVGLKADGIFSKIHALWDIGGVSQAASLLNMVANTYPLTVQGAPRFDRNRGFLFDGVDDYLETGYAFAAGQQNDAHFGLINRTAGVGATTDFGNNNSALQMRTASDQCFYRVNSTNGSNAIAGITSAVGHWISSRITSASTGNKLFRDGAVISSAVGFSSQAPDTNTFRIGGRSGTSTVYSARFFGGMVHVGLGLTDTDVTNLTSRIATYRAAVERAPILDNATNKTRALLAYLRSHVGVATYVVGTHDRFDTSGIAPDWQGEFEKFHTMTGKYPAYMQLEYCDPLGDATRYANMVARIKELYALGCIIMLHDHPGNPSTGNLYDNMPNTGEGAGTSWDTTGNPGLLATVLTGGINRTKFLDYCDRLAACLNTDLVVNGERIPVILRWWHEVNGNWFWWGTTETTAANFQQMYRDFIDRLIAQGVTSALFAANWGSDQTNMGARYAGDAYNDFISLDHYDNASSSSLGLNKSNVAPRVTEARALSTVNQRPFYFAEVGYELAASAQADIWDTYNGDVMEATYQQAVMFGFWRPPWGPAPGNSNNASLVDMVNSANCITLDKLSGVYG